jgi:uncharacterized protein (UPF0335 family)
MDLKNFVQLLKDFSINKFTTSKDISDVYKNVAKGQLLELHHFVECLAKLAYRSLHIQQEIKDNALSA